MKLFFNLLLILCVVTLFKFNFVNGGKKYVSNLSTTCLKCLCHASTLCNMSYDCEKNYCGPFFITKEFWRLAGRATLKDDDPDRANAFIDCSKDYTCASTTVENYMAKFGYDCNNDGVTDCDDYARLLFHGKDKCGLTLGSLNFGKRYESCKPVSAYQSGNRK